MQLKQTKASHRQTNDGYGALVRLFGDLGIVRRDLVSWRLLPEPLLGQINSIPASFGRCHATNGIECLIIQGSHAYFIGHFQHFVPDSSELERVASVKQQTKVKALKGDY